MIDVDITTPTPAARPPTQAYRGDGAWSLVSIISIIAAALSVLLVVWFVVSAHSIKKQVDQLTIDSGNLDTQIAEANKLNGSTLTVEQRAQELVTTVGQFQKLVDGRKLWGKLIPEIAKDTLQGVTLTGLSIDDKQSIKVDGLSHATSTPTESFTPYGLIARQVVAYRDAKTDAGASQTSAATKSATVFNNVTLNSISETTKKDSKTGADQAEGHFSMSFTLNPDVLKLPTTAKPATTSVTPQATP